MSPAAEILVAILSITLSVFLAFGIVLVIYLIKLTRDIRKVTESAGRTVDSLHSAVSKLSKLAPPIFIADFLSKYFKKSKKDKKGE